MTGSRGTMKPVVVFSIALSLGCLCLAQEGGILQNPGCPRGYEAVNERCLLYSKEEATWAEAMASCTKRGGMLATVDTYDVQVFLTGIAETDNKRTSVNISTQDDYVYHYLHDSGVDITGRNSIVFLVKACHDAHIAFSTNKGLDSRDTYEIVIGGWSDTASVIRDCKQCANKDEMRTNSNDHPLSCTDLRPFWISWSNNYIRVGHGSDVGESQFMAWNDTDPHAVNFIAVATGFGSSGTWTFPIDSYMPGKFWVGAADLVTETEWYWLPSQTRLGAYTNWAPNEPDNSGGNQHCMALDMHNAMKWRDENCDEKRNYICQNEMDLSSTNEIIG